MKLWTSKESRTDCDAITTCISSSAGIQDVLPCGESSGIWLSTKKVDVLLTHKERNSDDWIARRRIIVGNRNGVCGISSQTHADRIAQAQSETLRAFDVAVINNRNEDGL